MNGNKLDEFDIKILKLLQQNARMTDRQIAQAIGLTDSPVHRRIIKMENTGIIKGYSVIIERERSPEPVLVMLLVKLKDPSTKLIHDFKLMLDHMPQVLNCKLISGNWNFVIEVSAATPQAYAGWLMENILRHGFIADNESAYLMKEFKIAGSFKL
jgi:Lrp/AsnC family transcriptional regulator, leucine-responsive regulatory protein